MEHDDVVGYAGLASMLNVGRRAPAVWRQRNQLPTPDFAQINNGPAWRRDTVIRWAIETGRAGRLANEADRRRAVELGAQIEVSA